VPLLLTADALTVNPAVVDPAATTTDAGILTTDPEAMPIVTVSPPVGAGADTVIVQAAAPGVIIVAGAHFNPLTVSLAVFDVMVTTPLVAVTPTALSLSVAPLPLITWIVAEESVAVGDTAKMATATTPLASAVAFIPNNTQVKDPEPPVHESDFPAATAAGPAVTVTELKSVGA
jgi:hypothetical protein